VEWNRPAAAGRSGWEYEILHFKRGIEQPTPYDQGDLRMIYGLRYCLDEDDGPGYVHLTGRNDRFDPEDVRMVWDSTHAGKWHTSTPSSNVRKGVLMLETLYKTKSPEEVPAEEAEYFELILDQAPDTSRRTMYFVREMHGWWSEERKQSIHSLKTLSPEEGYPTWEAAYERDKQQPAFGAGGGFIHSFSPHTLRAEEVRISTHQRVKPAERRIVG
jgi:hypothetical protein